MESVNKAIIITEIVGNVTGKMSNTIGTWLEEQRIKGGSHGFECIGIARMQQVWDAAREELEQQLAAGLQDELSNRKKQIVMLRETLCSVSGSLPAWQQKKAMDTLAATDDDFNDCILCHGEPVSWANLRGGGYPVYRAKELN